MSNHRVQRGMAKIRDYRLKLQLAAREERFRPHLAKDETICGQPSLKHRHDEFSTNANLYYLPSPHKRIISNHGILFLDDFPDTQIFFYLFWDYN